MKKIKMFMFILCASLICSISVRAESFYEGKFLQGEYINKEKDGMTNFVTMQFVKDSKGNIVYCLEPFILFKNGKAYREIEGDVKQYKNLSEEQIRKISLIIYYGYGYTGRLDKKWYAITQYLVWKVVDSVHPIYFTKTLNGKKINKYETEIMLLMNDVNNHNSIPSFARKYKVNYGDRLYIPDIPLDDYKIHSDLPIRFDNGLIIDKVIKSGIIYFQKLSNYYQDNFAIFDSNESQDIIRPGNVVNSEHEALVSVLMGSLTLDIRDDDSVYTKESDFTDTCYNVIGVNNGYLNKVCTGKESLIYNIPALPLGRYRIEQISTGGGYKKDYKVKEVVLDENNANQKVVLENELIKNKIEIVKYSCKENKCVFEPFAKFDIYDKFANKVDTIVTNNLGYANIVLGYGTYNVKQIYGKDNYTLADPYSEDIFNEIDTHYKELFNYYIEKDEVKGEEDIVPPDTKTDSIFCKVCDYFILLISKIVYMI